MNSQIPKMFKIKDKILTGAYRPSVLTVPIYVAPRVLRRPSIAVDKDVVVKSSGDGVLNAAG